MRVLLGYLGRHHWGIVGTFIALGGAAYAAGGGSSNSIHACVNKASGGVQIAHRCQRDEYAVTWAKAGPQGLPGPSDGYFRSSMVGGSGSTSVKVPPGDYIASGGCWATQARTASQSSTIPAFGEAELILTTEASFSPEQAPPGTETFASVPNMGQQLLQGPPPGESGSASLSTSTGFHLARGGTIFEDCGEFIEGLGMGGSEQPLTFSGGHVTAIRVGNLHGQ
jgi:hypothetical protein